MDEADLARLGDYLRACDVGVEGPLEAAMIAGGRSNWTYRLSDGSSAWVLRRPPSAGLTPSAHDVAREHRITESLAPAGVPVARPIALCEDHAVLGVPFTVAEFVDGVVIRERSDLDTTETPTDDIVAGLLKALVTLHHVDHRSVGLGSFAKEGDYAGRQLRRWSGQWDRVKTGDLKDARALMSGLAAALPSDEQIGVVHGDYRIDNVLLDREDPTEVLAIVDWELSTLGDPVADVALMCTYRNPALDLVLGFPAAWSSAVLPAPSEIADGYLQAGGRDLSNWRFHLALAHFKLAVIAQGIDHRYRAGATQGEGFDKAGDAVAPLLAAGLTALRAA